MGYGNMNIDSGGKFLRVKGGETVEFHIITKEPVKLVVHGFGKDRVDCIGKDCNMCREGSEKKQRWVINVFDRKENMVKIFEFGPMIASQLRELALMLKEDHKTVHDVDFRIKAAGSGMDTEYVVMQKEMTSPLPEGLEEYPLS